MDLNFFSWMFGRVPAMDFGTSAGNIKGWQTKKAKGISKEPKYKPFRDSLGPLPDLDDLSTFTVEKNVERGNAALERSLRSKHDVKKAMFTKELGWIDFDWGTIGNRGRDHVGGWGISHVADKHKSDLDYLVPLIANNPCRVLPRTFGSDGSRDPQRYCITDGERIAFLDARGSAGSFCVTEYSRRSASEYMKYPLAKPRGFRK